MVGLELSAEIHPIGGFRGLSWGFGRGFSRGVPFPAPILIIGGGGLVAFGGLTLFGLDLVFKTRTQAILGICVGLLLLGVLEIRFYASGASFFENQKVGVGYCQ